MPESSDLTTDAVEESVVLPAALHARPAGALVRALAGIDAAVEIAFGGRVANARGVLGVMGLGAPAGSTVVVRASGSEAARAARTAAEVLATAE
jgi:phosphotransferase system HPr (HPr) family protein